jgi:hypothetical protein
MADLTAMLQAAAGQAGEDTDPFFNQTTLLLHGDGTNGAQNNTFLDSSSNTFTITRNGNTTQGTFSPFSLPNGEFSNFFDGSGDYLTTPSNAALSDTLLASDFTIETWLYLMAAPSDGAAIWTNSVSDSDGFSTSYIYNNLSVATGKAGVNEFVSSANVLTLNTWNHFACVRNGATVYIYVNGTQVASGAAATYLNTTATKPMKFGSNSQTSPAAITGYFSNIRVVSSAVYTSAFTPPTAPLTAISNTQLLTCQSNRFVDNSTNNFAITVAGNTSVQPFSPFLPSAAYDPSVNGGSGYFDGSGDYLEQVNTASSALDVSSGDWTVQVWIYPTAPGNDYATVFSLGTTVDSQTNAWSLHMNSNYQMFILISGSGGSINASANTAVGPFAWNHVALSRASGTTTMYVNGVSVGTTATAMPSTQYASIGGYSFYTDKNTFPGYISGVQLLKGTSINFASVGVPTAPPTAIANTSLLCNFTNAGIFDNTGKNNLETVADAQIDTSVKKYGTGSMEFDGTGDYLQSPSNSDFLFFTGDMTIEAWVYFNSVANATFVNTSGVTSGFYWQYYNSNLGFGRAGGGTDVSSAWSPSATTWYHIATVRSGNTITHYVDGTSIGSGSFTDSISATTVLQIGTGGAGSLNGYIDDLRITKGVARYTAAFTPPTQAFPDL